MDVFELAVVSCGNTFLVVLAIIEISLLLLSFYLIAFVRHQHAIGLCLPITFAPIFAGCCRTLMTLATAVALSQGVSSKDDEQANIMMLMGVSLTPLLLGAVFTAPAFILLSFARFFLAIRAHLPKRPKVSPPEEEKTIVTASAIEDELASNYLAKLTRSRH